MRGFFLDQGPFTDYTTEDVRKLIFDQTSTVFRLSQASLPIKQMQMQEKQGRQVVVSITTSMVDHPIAGGHGFLWPMMTKGGNRVHLEKNLAMEICQRRASA